MLNQKFIHIIILIGRKKLKKTPIGKEKSLLKEENFIFLRFCCDGSRVFLRYGQDIFIKNNDYK